MNQLTRVGFTGNDTEVHHTPSGTLVGTISVATKGSWKSAADQRQSRTGWYRVVSFGKLAEYARTLGKGSHVMVQGPGTAGNTSAMASRTACSSFSPTG